MHIVFDFDGTLVDSKDTILKIYNSIASGSNRPHITGDIFRKLSKLSIFERFKIFDASAAEMMYIYHEIEKRYYENAGELELFDGIKQLVNDLSEDNKLYILSTNTKRVIRKVIANHSIEKCFESLYTSKNMLGKARSLKRMMKANSMDPSRTVYIGDEERDVLASKKAKIPVISVTWGFDSEELLRSACPDCIAGEPGQIKGFIEGMKKDEGV